MRSWRVTTRYVNQTDPLAPLVQARKLRFEAPDRLPLHPQEQEAGEGAVTTTGLRGPETDAVNTTASEPIDGGTWTLQRDPLLSWPYIQLHLPEGETRPLITRRSPDGEACEMMLYFQTGMEGELQCA